MYVNCDKSCLSFVKKKKTAKLHLLQVKIYSKRDFAVFFMQQPN